VNRRSFLTRALGAVTVALAPSFAVRVSKPEITAEQIAIEYLEDLNKRLTFDPATGAFAISQLT